MADKPLALPRGRYTAAQGASFSDYKGPPARAAEIPGLASKLANSLVHRMQSEKLHCLAGSAVEPDGTTIHCVVFRNARGEPMVQMHTVAPEGGSSGRQCMDTTFALHVESGVLVLEDGWFKLEPSEEQKRQARLEQDQLLDDIKLELVCKADNNHRLSRDFTFRDYSDVMHSLAYPTLPDFREPYRQKIINEVTVLKWPALSGKMKQLMQARIVGKFEPYVESDDTQNLNPYRDGLTQRLINRCGLPGGMHPLDPPVHLYESARHSTLLYTVSIGHYYVLELDDNDVTAVEIKAPAFVRFAIERLFKVLEEREFKGKPFSGDDPIYQRYETYVLSTCVLTGRTFTISGIATGGNPLWYGWKANWKGDRLAIVGHASVYPDGIDSTLTVIGLAEVIEKDGEGKEVMVLTAEKIAEETVRWGPRNVSMPRVWRPIGEYRPDVIPGGTTLAEHSLAHIFMPCFHNYLVETADKAPLYCYFDSENKLVVARYSCEYSASKTSGDERTIAEFYDTKRVGAESDRWYEEYATDVYAYRLAVEVEEMAGAEHFSYPKKGVVPYEVSGADKRFSTFEVAYIFGEVTENAPYCVQNNYSGTYTVRDVTYNRWESPTPFATDYEGEDHCGGITGEVRVSRGYAPGKFLIYSTSGNESFMCGLVIPDGCGEAVSITGWTKRADSGMKTIHGRAAEITARGITSGETKTRCWHHETCPILDIGVSTTNTYPVTSHQEVQFGTFTRTISEDDVVFEEDIDTISGWEYESVTPKRVTSFFIPALCGADPWLLYRGNFNAVFGVEGEGYYQQHPLTIDPEIADPESTWALVPYKPECTYEEERFIETFGDEVYCGWQ